MSKRNKIVVVDDNRGVLAAVSLLLRPYFNQVITLQSPVRLEEVLRDGVPDCLLLDMNFSAGINTGNEGIYWLNRVKRLYPDLPVVLFTAYGDIDLAVRGMKEGAVDFIIKQRCFFHIEFLHSLYTAHLFVITQSHESGIYRKNRRSIEHGT
ncbi:response regulator, partial [uncultured Muribaculum sp.]|uniref:response regulator n=1 Tax=uncultured Muribaculum sp. TaxID=1918613 RepID=UPI003459D818